MARQPTARYSSGLPQLHEGFEAATAANTWVQRANAWASTHAMGRAPSETKEGFAMSFPFPMAMPMPMPMGAMEGASMYHAWTRQPEAPVMRAEGFAVDDQKWMISTPDGSADLNFVPKNGGNWDASKQVTFGADGRASVGQLQVRGSLASLGNDARFRGGVSEHNPGRWQTHFPWPNNNKNYIRGDTEIRGNTTNIGDLSVGRRIYFRNTSMGDNTDPYYLEKVETGGNRSSLRLTINDDNDEVFEIWGNSCREAGGCRGPGAMKHRFQANGDAEHKGDLTVGNTIRAGDQLCAGDVCVTKDDLTRLKNLSTTTAPSR